MTRFKGSRWLASFFLAPSELDLLRLRVRTELPRGQARVILGLLCLPEDPISYDEIAEAFQIHLGTVHTHMRRVRVGHPELYRSVMLERRRQLGARHRAVLEERRERALRWGRRRYAARYRQTHGRWPWEVMRDG
jgi:hypothetical protein